MADRRSQSNLATRRRGKGSRAEALTLDRLLKYLVIPLPLPAFDISGFTFQQDLVNSIQGLLVKAVKELLPDKVLGIQFIFAKRPTRRNHDPNAQVEGDFSFPLLLLCGNFDEALGVADGMAYVTKHLMTRQASFHVRVRSNRLTYSPAVCIYSTEGFEHLEELQYSATTVLWVQLDAKNDGDFSVRFPKKHLTSMRRQAYRGRTFYQADLRAAIQEGYFSDVEPPAIPAPPPLYQPGNIVGIVQESDLTDPSRERRLQKLREQLGSDTEYLERVSYLLNFGDVILCTPHAYHAMSRDQPDNPMNPHDTITDAGLTVILDRNKGKITEDDWLRIQVVAQKLAIFAGAAVSTATEARESIFRTLHKGFGHEFTNAVLSVLGSLHSLKDNNGGSLLSTVDMEDIEGRLRFTNIYLASTMEVYKDEAQTVKEALENLIAELRKHKDVDLQAEIELSGSELMLGLWHTVLIEVIRNAYKHGAPSDASGRIRIAISATIVSSDCLITISNIYKDDDYKRKIELGVEPDDVPQGWPLVVEMATFLGGECRPHVDGNHVSISVRIPLLSTAERSYV